MGVERGDRLVLQDGVPLNAQVGAVQPVDAFLGANPYLVLKAFDQAGDGNAVGGYLLAFQSLAVEFHHVEMTVVHAGKHFACAACQQRTSGAEFVVAFIGLEGVGDLVGGAVEHEHAVVVHQHPDVLRLVDGQVADAVVQVLDAAAVARLVVVEVIPVEARQTVPGGNPDIAQIVLVEHRYGIAA